MTSSVPLSAVGLVCSERSSVVQCGQSWPGGYYCCYTRYRPCGRTKPPTTTLCSWSRAVRTRLPTGWCPSTSPCKSRSASKRRSSCTSPTRSATRCSPRGRATAGTQGGAVANSAKRSASGGWCWSGWRAGGCAPCAGPALAARARCTCSWRPTASATTAPRSCAASARTTAPSFATTCSGRASAAAPGPRRTPACWAPRAACATPCTAAGRAAPARCFSLSATAARWSPLRAARPTPAQTRAKDTRSGRWVTESATSWARRARATPRASSACSASPGCRTAASPPTPSWTPRSSPTRSRRPPACPEWTRTSPWTCSRQHGASGEPAGPEHSLCHRYLEFSSPAMNFDSFNMDTHRFLFPSESVIYVTYTYLFV